MDSNLLNMALYLYERYLDGQEEPPPRAALENALRADGVPALKAARVLDWLERFERAAPPLAPPRAGAHRVYSAFERARLSMETRGLLLRLEQSELIGPAERELAIERALALGEPEVGIEAMQWVVLLTLFYLSGREAALTRMEDLCYPDPDLDPATH